MSTHDEPRRDVTVHASSAAVGVSMLQAYARTRMQFAVQHLLASARMARDVDAAEPRDPGVPFGGFFDIVLQGSVGCVLLAVASLEAYANEIFADRGDHFGKHNAAIVEAMWDEYERKPVLDKFDLALLLLDKAKLDRGSAKVQAVHRLVELRNALVHFHPEWDDSEEGKHDKLSKKLDGYAGRSPWLATEPLFPRAWALGRRLSGRSPVQTHFSPSSRGCRV